MPWELPGHAQVHLPRHAHDGGLSYHFIVMPCFGEDIQKKFDQAGRQFGIETVFYLALRLLEALQFLHTSEYAHADIKGTNVLTGHPLSHQHEVSLVDYGLVYKFSFEGRHREYKDFPHRRHEGTLVFTSIDAHNLTQGSHSCPSRRPGDPGLLFAAVGCWEGCLGDKERVAQFKMKYQSDVTDLMRDCFIAGPIYPPPRVPERVHGLCVQPGLPAQP